MGATLPAQPAPRDRGPGSTFLTGADGGKDRESVRWGALTSQLLPASSTKASRIGCNVLRIFGTTWGPEAWGAGDRPGWCLSLPSLEDRNPNPSGHSRGTLSGAGGRANQEREALIAQDSRPDSQPARPYLPLGQGPGLTHLWLPPTCARPTVSELLSRAQTLKSHSHGVKHVPLGK